MSRTAQSEIQENPVKTFISFNGKEGKFGARVEAHDEFESVPFPFTFVVIDCDAFSVGGKITLAKDAPRFRANIAHAAFSRKLTVVLDTDKDKILASGTWGAIKGLPQLSKAKYTQLIYALCDIGKGKELVRISLHGKALAAWMNITKDLDPCGDVAFRVTGVETTDSKEGGPSQVPILEVVKVSQETLDAAAKMDQDVLRPWFVEYFSNLDGTKSDTPTQPAPATSDTPAPSSPAPVVPATPAPVADDNEDLPF